MADPSSVRAICAVLTAVFVAVLIIRLRRDGEKESTLSYLLNLGLMAGLIVTISTIAMPSLAIVARDLYMEIAETFRHFGRPY